MRLMVVDDTKMNLELMKILINRWGCSGIYFESGPEAVSFVQQAEASQLPHVTFMDFHMPGMDGCETTRALLELKPDMPIIGLTADVTPECLESALKSGMQEVLPKPYKEKRLIHACRKYMPPHLLSSSSYASLVAPVHRPTTPLQRLSISGSMVNMYQVRNAGRLPGQRQPLTSPVSGDSQKYAVQDIHQGSDAGAFPPCTNQEV